MTQINTQPTSALHSQGSDTTIGIALTLIADSIGSLISYYNSHQVSGVCDITTVFGTYMKINGNQPSDVSDYTTVIYPLSSITWSITAPITYTVSDISVTIINYSPFFSQATYNSATNSVDAIASNYTNGTCPDLSYTVEFTVTDSNNNNYTFSFDPTIQPHVNT